MCIHAGIRRERFDFSLNSHVAEDVYKNVHLKSGKVLDCSGVDT